MRTSAIGAPFSTARIGSTRPLPTLMLMEPAASCWITLAFDCAKMRSTLMSAAWKSPLRMPICTGHRLVELEDTPPATTVSAAPRGGAYSSAEAMSRVIVAPVRMGGLFRDGAASSALGACGAGVVVRGTNVRDTAALHL